MYGSIKTRHVYISLVIPTSCTSSSSMHTVSLIRVLCCACGSESSSLYSPMELSDKSLTFTVSLARVVSLHCEGISRTDPRIFVNNAACKHVTFPFLGIHFPLRCKDFDTRFRLMLWVCCELIPWRKLVRFSGRIRFVSIPGTCFGKACIGTARDLQHVFTFVPTILSEKFLILKMFCLLFFFI